MSSAQAEKTDSRRERPEPSPEEKAVVAVIRCFAKAFATHDTDMFMSVWDQEYGDRIVYQPEEIGTDVKGLDGVKAYFDHVPQVVRALRDVKTLEFRAELLEDNYALVHNRFWCRLALHKRPFVYDGQVRQSFVLRKRDGEWKVLHYHESRQSPGFEEAVGSW
ncbi:MAG: hypothetical protein GEV10_25710 [Streptosporangiales bacterium]|nr:hypothetical protein [Streptosporangiales bacterium]